MTILNSSTGGLSPSRSPGAPDTEPAEPSSPSDASVIRTSLAEPESFASIFDRHAPTVHRYLSRRLGTTEADDLLGEVFLRAFENRGRFRTDVDSARPWLLGIATHLISERRRSEDRQFRAYTRAAYTVEDPHFPDEVVAAQVDAASAMGPLSAVLAAMNPGDRDVLLLFAWGDLTYPEIAAALDIPVGTVRSRLSRTRASLRATLPTLSPEGPDNE